MLLEYSVDTVDEKIGPSAIEIRRRIAERALKSSSLSTETLLFCKEKSRDEKNEHTAIDLSVKAAFLQDRVSLTRSEHHLIVSQQVRLCLGKRIVKSFFLVFVFVRFVDLIEM